MLAYYDSLRYGLIPCKVERLTIGEHGQRNMVIRFTANRGGQARRKGEVIETIPANVVPRPAVHVRNGQQYVRHYFWYLDEQGQPAFGLQGGK